MENSILLHGMGTEKLTYMISKCTNIPLCDQELSHFGNGETRVEINSNIRNKDVIIIAHMRTGSVNDDFMSLIMLVDACRRGDAYRINIAIPYYPYSRSDKKDRPRVPIGSATIAHILNMYRVDNVISLDLHSAQLQGLIDRGFHNLYAINLMTPVIQSEINNGDSRCVLISPDVGGIKRVEAYARKLNMEHVILHKVRDYSNPGTVLKSIIIGDPSQYKGKIGILIDDMADSMGTMVSATEKLVEHGIEKVIIVVTHGIFSGKAISRINDCRHISKVICTDSLPQEENVKACEKLQIVTCSKLIGDTLEAILEGKSVSVLFS